MGKNKLTFPRALERIFLASSNRELSIKDFPISIPRAFKKVNAIPPPIKILSANAIKCLIKSNLESIFFPPKITVKGFLGLLNFFDKNSNSFSKRRPGS